MLSGMKSFSKAKTNLEQYSTPADIAADALWNMFLNKDIEDKKVIDLGCGTGILGIGALLLGAKKAYFVDVDDEAIILTKKNLAMFDKRFSYDIIQCDVQEFNKRADVVIQNPPFGVQKKHSDIGFLIKAMQLAPIIYSFHKIESKAFIERLSQEQGFRVSTIYEYVFELPKTADFHIKRRHKVKVGLWKLEKQL